MKNLFLLFIFFLGKFFWVNAQNYTFEQSVAILANNLEQFENFDLVDFNIVPIKEGNSYMWDINLIQDHTYMVFAVSQYGIQDLGLFIYDDYNQLITTDLIQQNNGYTFASVRANYTSKARIMATNLDSFQKRKYKIGLIVIRSVLSNSEIDQLLSKYGF